MRKLVAVLIVATAVFFLAGCESVPVPGDEGYQFGDTTDALLTKQAQYCATADPRQRAVLLALIQATGVPVPDRGACTDILTLVDERNLEVPEEVDIEAAEKDRQDALDRLNAE